MYWRGDIMMNQMSGGWVHGIEEMRNVLRRLQSKVKEHYLPIQKWSECLEEYNGRIFFDTTIGIGIFLRYRVQNGQKVINVTYLTGTSTQELFLCQIKFLDYITRRDIVNQIRDAFALIIHHRLYLDRKIIVAGKEMRAAIESKTDLRQRLYLELQLSGHRTKYLTDYFRYVPGSNNIHKEPAFIG